MVPNIMKNLIVICYIVSMIWSISAQAAQPTVNLPVGINLGATSFYDGISGSPGEAAWQLYVGYSRSTELKDKDGNNFTIINDPEFEVYSFLNQYSYIFDIETTVLGGHPGIDIIIPMAKLESSFKAGPPFPGLQLEDNDTGVGDPTISIFLQYEPYKINGNPVFFSRLNAGVTMPLGKYDSEVDFNQGNNIWSFHLYYAMTFFFSEEWSISLRPQYYYNLENNEPASSYPLDDGIRNTQPGQSFSINYNVSYMINENLSVGLGGYYLKQITDDKVNGDNIDFSREQVLGFGPQLFFDMGDNKLYITAFSESKVENRFKQETSVVFRWLHLF